MIACPGCGANLKFDISTQQMQCAHCGGNYLLINEYKVETPVDLEYEGYSHDASKAFADDISECLEPFGMENRKSFTPGYLSGFYVDGADEDSEAYRREAIEFYNNLTAEKLMEDLVVRTDAGYLAATGVQDVQVPTEVKEIQQVLKPVWFMSYRDGKRITYATVNGETGKVVADFPVSPWRYLLSVLLGTGLLFTILNYFLTLKPEWALAVTALLMLLGRWIGEKPFRMGSRDGKEKKPSGNIAGIA